MDAVAGDQRAVPTLARAAPEDLGVEVHQRHLPPLGQAPDDRVRLLYGLVMVTAGRNRAQDRHAVSGQALLHNLLQLVGIGRRHAVA